MKKLPLKADGRKVIGESAPGVASLAALQRDYFLPYQWRWIRDEAPKKLYPKSRRIGVTYATSFRCVLKCLRVANLTQWVSSKDMGLAQEFIAQYVAKWCELANIVATGLGAQDVLNLGKDKKGNDITAFQVRFPNGSRIVSLSSNPRAFAGKGGDILIDEMDLHEDQAPLYDMAQPCTQWGGQLEIVSAYDPEGSEETVFAQLVREARDGGNPKGWSLHETDIDQAVAEGLVEKINVPKAKRGYKVQTRGEFLAAQRADCRTLEAWLSQYKCQPVSAAGQQAFAAMDLENSLADYMPTIVRFDGKESLREYSEGKAPDPVVRNYVDKDLQKEIAWLKQQHPNATWAFGYDVAQKKHLASMFLNAVEGKRKRMAALFLFHGCSGDSQFYIASGLISGLGANGAGDETGPGVDVCNRLLTKWGEFRWESVNFSSSKRELVGDAVGAFERGEQVLPRLPKYIKADFGAVRRATGTGGKLIYAEATNAFMDESHCDIAYSGMLAIRAAAKATGPVDGERLQRGRGAEAADGRGGYEHPDNELEDIPAGTAVGAY